MRYRCRVVRVRVSVTSGRELSRVVVLSLECDASLPYSSAGVVQAAEQAAKWYDSQYGAIGDDYESASWFVAERWDDTVRQWEEC